MAKNLAPTDDIDFGDAVERYPPVFIDDRRLAWLALHKAVRLSLEHHLQVLHQLADELLTSPKGRLRGGRIHEVITEFHKERPYSTDAVMENLSLELTEILGTPRYPPVYAIGKDGWVLGATNGFSDPSGRYTKTAETTRTRRVVEELMKAFSGSEPKRRAAPSKSKTKDRVTKKPHR